mmetsp:Transcript_8359/g.21392  ORF Transcript_8359/g.21392 Transcript_8359/m.21392 type:complete len:200 (-) Transcript_8359:255-854(-)
MRGDCFMLPSKSLSPSSSSSSSSEPSSSSSVELAQAFWEARLIKRYVKKAIKGKARMQPAIWTTKSSCFVLMPDSEPSLKPLDMPHWRCSMALLWATSSSMAGSGVIVFSIVPLVSAKVSSPTAKVSVPSTWSQDAEVWLCIKRMCSSNSALSSASVQEAEGTAHVTAGLSSNRPGLVTACTNGGGGKPKLKKYNGKTA